MSILAPLEAKLAELDERISALEAENEALIERLMAFEGGCGIFTRDHIASMTLRAVGQASGVKVDDIRGLRIFPQFVRARAAVIHMLRDQGLSLTEIGATIRRDHTTAVHHLRKPPPNDIIRQAEKLLARTG